MPKRERAADDGDTAEAQMADEVLEYASTCIIPTTFIDLPLIAKREYNHDSTIYTFGLPEGKSLSLPVCACILLKAPGRGRGPNGKDDFDGSDAIRPYTPVSDNSMLGQFELCIKRYDGGAVSQWLYGLELGAKVGFKHISFNIKSQYPFDGKKSINRAGGINPLVQLLSDTDYLPDSKQAGRLADGLGVGRTHLETVVLSRVVRGGGLDAAIAVEVVDRECDEGRVHQADLHHVAPTGPQSLLKGGDKRRRGQPHVVPHRDSRRSGLSWRPPSAALCAVAHGQGRKK